MAFPGFGQIAFGAYFVTIGPMYEDLTNGQELKNQLPFLAAFLIELTGSLV